MRKLGYTLLILGAFYYVILSLRVVLEASTFGANQFDQLLTPLTWTRGQVREFLDRVISDFAREIVVPRLLFGALLMFCGGVFLDIAGRRKQAQPNTSLEPTATAPSASSKP
jgi:hypothetical protein